MYTNGEISELRRTFWTVFGQYMAPVLSADGEKVSWMNYKTGGKHISFKMQVNEIHASISIELTHPDISVRHLYFNQFKEHKLLLEDILNEQWIWEIDSTNVSGKIFSRIYKELSQVSLFNKEDWPAIITFLKPRIIALDNFWSTARYAFQSLH